MPLATLAGRQIEYRMIPDDAAQPTLVFLHEGLGAVALWRDFPDKLAGRAGRAGAHLLAFRLRPVGAGSPPHARPASCTRRRWRSCRPCWTELPDRAPAAGRPFGRGIHRPHRCLGLRATGRGPGADGAARVRRGRDRAQHLPHPRHLRVDGSQGTAGQVPRARRRSLPRLGRHRRAPILAWSIEELVPGVSRPMLLVQGRDDEYGTLAHRLSKRLRKLLAV